MTLPTAAAAAASPFRLRRRTSGIPSKRFSRTAFALLVAFLAAIAFVTALFATTTLLSSQRSLSSSFSSSESMGTTATSLQKAQRSLSSSMANTANDPASPLVVEGRLRGALWGLFGGDALASPTHWYYGGPSQVRRDYGPSGITTYAKPVFDLHGSILNKSNVNGGGRGSFGKKPGFDVTIIGDVINHGKLPYWDPQRSVHYHATLKAGENTLEAQLARVLMKSVVDTGGVFDPDRFREAYVKFMTTPGSHNDTYASTCHRMFFANMIFGSRKPEDCPDNDGHNVDTADGLVLPTVAALAASASSSRTASGADAKRRAAEWAAECASVTRRSPRLGKASEAWAGLVYESLHAREEGDGMADALAEAARGMGMRRAPRSDGRDEMSACYLDQSAPPTLDMISKYLSRDDNDAWTGLLANANVGGENVHRGALMGAVLGARAGVDRLPSKMTTGLHRSDEIGKEIDDFVRAVMGAGKADAEETS